MPSCDICPICDGTGKRNPVSGEICITCNGTGIVEDKDEDDFDDAPDFGIFDWSD